MFEIISVLYKERAANALYNEVEIKTHSHLHRFQPHSQENKSNCDFMFYNWLFKSNCEFL